jgi:hypothetical protein
VSGAIALVLKVADLGHENLSAFVFPAYETRAGDSKLTQGHWVPAFAGTTAGWFH